MKKTLKDACEFFNGTGFPISFQGQSVGKYPFYKVGDISKNVQQGYKYLEVCENYINDDIISQLKGTIIPANSIVFAKIGEALKLNRRAITKQPSLVDNNAIAIHPNEELLDVDYFFYFMKTVNLADYSSSTTVPSVKKSALDKIQLTVPSILTQKDIANELNCISDAISIAKNQLLSLDELVKSRFIEMFVNKGFPTLFWDSVFITKTGKLDSNAMVENGKYPFFTCAKEVFNIDKYAFDQEALLLAGNNAVGKYDVKYYQGKFNAYQRTYVLSLKDKNWSYRCFQYQLQDKLDFLQLQSKGSNTKYLTLKILAELGFIIPPIALQNEFAEFIKLIDKSKFIVQQQIKDLEELLDSKMDEYFR